MRTFAHSSNLMPTLSHSHGISLSLSPLVKSLSVIEAIIYRLDLSKISFEMPFYFSFFANGFR